MKIKTAVIEAVESVKCELRREFEVMIGDTNEKFSKEIVQLKSEISQLQMKIDTQTKSLEQEFLNDIHEAEMRKNNLMIFGLDEDSNTSSKESKESDIRSLHKLASELGVTDIQISDCFRLGRRGEKPRPLKVICRLPHQRSDLLNRAFRIPRINVALGYRRVFIKPDLSPKEQEAHRLLRKELMSRREAGERVIIRNGKIAPSDILRSSGRD